MKARYTPTIGVEALLPLPCSSSPTCLGEPLSCPCLSSVSVVHLPWPPPPPRPLVLGAERQEEQTWDGPVLAGHSQQGAVGDTERRNGRKTTVSCVCVCV